MLKLIKRYGILGSLYLARCYVMTKLIIPNARIIRFPIDLRSKNHMKFEDGLVTGRNCRLEIEKIETLTKGEIRLTLGKNLQMNDFCHITAAEKVVIGDNVLIASKVYISDVSHGNYSGAMEHSSSSTLAVERPLISSPVTIEDNVWLGDGVCVLPGAYIGKNSIIGANAVVTGIIPPNCIAVGIPAKVVKIYNQQNKTWETIK